MINEIGIGDMDFKDRREEFDWDSIDPEEDPYLDSVFRLEPPFDPDHDNGPAGSA